MIYAGSIITIEKEHFEAVKLLLEEYPQVMMFTQSDDKTQLVVSIEEESSHGLETLCSRLKDHPEIIDIAHTNFFFGDEVEKMHQQEQQLPVEG